MVDAAPRTVKRYKRVKLCAALIPVGPSSADVDRLCDLLDSLTSLEPAARLCVLIDDSKGKQKLETIHESYPSLDVVVLPNPRDRERPASRGRSPCLAAGVLSGLAWVQANANVDFVLKLDLDALVIAPFHDAVTSFLQAHNNAGVVGCIGETCDRTHERYLRVLSLRSFFRRAMFVASAVRLTGAGSVARFVKRWPRPLIAGYSIDVLLEQYDAFNSLSQELSSAVSNGLSSHRYCQGGAYAIAPRMLDRMAIDGYFDHSEFWGVLPYFGEDTVTAMYAYAVGLDALDFSDVGQVFGLSYNGLPFSPDELVARGYALTHSVKNDPRFTEAEIRAFFAARRPRKPAAAGPEALNNLAARLTQAADTGACSAEAPASCPVDPRLACPDNKV